VPIDFKLVTFSPYTLTIYVNTAFQSTSKYHKLFRTFTFLYQIYSRISYFPYILYDSDHSIACDLFAVITHSN